MLQNGRCLGPRDWHGEPELSRGSFGGGWAAEDRSSADLGRHLWISCESLSRPKSAFKRGSAGPTASSGCVVGVGLAVPLSEGETPPVLKRSASSNPHVMVLRRVPASRVTDVRTRWHRDCHFRHISQRQLPRYAAIWRPRQRPAKVRNRRG